MFYADISSVIFALSISLFLINFKITFEINASLKLTSNDYIFRASIINTIFYLKHILLLSGDIELNPGSKGSSFTKFCY